MGMILHQSRGLCIKRRIRRGGYLYLSVLFTTLLLVTIVSSALHLSRVRNRGQVASAARQSVLRAAESTVHRLAARMRTDANWRITNVHNQFSPWRVADDASIFGQALVRHRYLDLDGDLADEETDAVELQVHAKSLDAEVAISTKMIWHPVPYDFLDQSITATHDLCVNQGAVVTCDGQVQLSNDLKSNTSGTLVTPLLKIGGSVTTNLRGDSEVSSPAEMVNLVDHYQAASQAMDAAAIPNSGGRLLIEDRLISPSSNPFGAASVQGIYSLNAGGLDVRISDCRIQGTLVITQAGKIEVRDGIVWEYATPYPEAILVSDSLIEFEQIDAVLDEAARSTNYNPVSTPYRSAHANSTTTDVFPQTLRGWIHSTANVSFAEHQDTPIDVVGGVYGSDILVTGRLRISALDGLGTTASTLLSDRVPMRFERGTWRSMDSPL